MEVKGRQQTEGKKEKEAETEQEKIGSVLICKLFPFLCYY